MLNGVFVDENVIMNSRKKNFFDAKNYDKMDAYFQLFYHIGVDFYKPQRIIKFSFCCTHRFISSHTHTKMYVDKK